MGAKLFTVLAALSLVLEVAFAVLAVRSYRVGHALFWLRHDDERFIERVADVRLVNGELRLYTSHTQHFERATHDRFKKVPEPGWRHVAMPPDDRQPYSAG